MLSLSLPQSDSEQDLQKSVTSPQTISSLGQANKIRPVPLSLTNENTSEK